MSDTEAHTAKSVESTMGFTALDGLPMGTRPAQLDPGIVLYLLTEKGMGAKEIERLFYHDSGLKGLGRWVLGLAGRRLSSTIARTLREPRRACSRGTSAQTFERRSVGFPRQ
jgi:acetate kinase